MGMHKAAPVPVSLRSGLPFAAVTSIADFVYEGDRDGDNNKKQKEEQLLSP